MPSKMATCFKEKAVLLAVYVEKPRRRKSVSNKNNGGHNHHHHHHHHHHLHLHPVKRGSSSNTNRRAELLKYSQRLRESAKSGTSSPDHPPKPAPIVSTHNQPQPMAQIIPSKSKTKNRRAPICMPWKIMTPKFFKSMTMLRGKKESKKQKKKKKKKKKKKSNESSSTKAKAIMKSFKAPKKGGFLSKVFATIQKYR